MACLVTWACRLAPGPHLVTGPATPEQDLALAAFAWVPPHVRYVIAAEGFTDFAGRPRRLGRFLGIYGWSASTGGSSTRSRPA